MLMQTITVYSVTLNYAVSPLVQHDEIYGLMDGIVLIFSNVQIGKYMQIKRKTNG